MWKVGYYMVGGTLTTRYFANLHEATQFAVYTAPLNSIDSMNKVKDGTAH